MEDNKGLEKQTRVSRWAPVPDVPVQTGNGGSDFVRLFSAGNRSLVANMTRLIPTASSLLNCKSWVCAWPPLPLLARPWASLYSQERSVNTNAIVTFLSITCRLFTARMKHILCSSMMRCTEVGGNSLSFLLQDKTILTSVRFAVNNPSGIGYRATGRQREREKGGRGQEGRDTESWVCLGKVSLNGLCLLRRKQVSGKYLANISKSIST